MFIWSLGIEDEYKSALTHNAKETFITLDIPEVNPNFKLHIEQKFTMEAVKCTASGCSTMNSIYKFLVSEANRKLYFNRDVVLFIRLEMINNFEDLKQGQVHKLTKKFRHRSVVLFFESNTNENFIILWKSKDISVFLRLVSYYEKFSNDDRQLCEFIAEFLIKSLCGEHLGK